MWDGGLIVLVLLCIVMAGASFGIGSLPLTLNLSPRALKLLTAFGTGVLVGTALIVIIPEGVETLYNAEGSSHKHDKRSVTGQFGARPVWARMPEDIHTADILSRSVVINADDHVHKLKSSATVQATDKDTTEGTFRAQFSYEPLRKEDDDDSDEDDHHGDDPLGDRQDSDNDRHDPHAYVGLSIIVGFILMYLIDNLPKHMATSSQPRRFQINLTSLSFNRDASDPAETAEEGTNAHDEARASSTTVGLVIHAAADGIALGASSTSKSSLSFVIFIALMVHKAPAAFGLTSALLKQGLGKRAARAHLIIFSLAAPVGALVTWFAAHLLGFASSRNTEFVTGILLLFSGGTFLYVAMHTMQDAPPSSEYAYESAGNGFAEGSMGVYEPPASNKVANQEALTSIGVTVLGMLLPLLTQFGHAH